MLLNNIMLAGCRPNGNLFSPTFQTAQQRVADFVSMADYQKRDDSLDHE
jgi:hypothetical protein